MLWAAYVTFTARRPWTARAWTSVLAVSAVVLLWTAWLHHLMAFGTRY